MAVHRFEKGDLDRFIKRCAECGDLSIISTNRQKYNLLCDFCNAKYPPKRRLTTAKLKEMRERVFALFGGLCYYCRKPAEVLDHLLPLARGGTNSESNLAASCRACNAKKHSKTPQEFYECG